MMKMEHDEAEKRAWEIHRNTGKVSVDTLKFISLMVQKGVITIDEIKEIYFKA